MSKTCAYFPMQESMAECEAAPLSKEETFLTFDHDIQMSNDNDNDWLGAADTCLEIGQSPILVD